MREKLSLYYNNSNLLRIMMGALCLREFRMRACQSAGIFQGGTDARWQTDVPSSHGVRALPYLPPFDQEISRRFQHPHVQLSGLVPMRGVCAVDLPGESARTTDHAR